MLSLKLNKQKLKTAGQKISLFSYLISAQLVM